MQGIRGVYVYTPILITQKSYFLPMKSFKVHQSVSLFKGILR